MRFISKKHLIILISLFLGVLFTPLFSVFALEIPFFNIRPKERPNIFLETKFLGVQSVSTDTPKSSVYLNALPYTGLGDMSKLVAFLLIVAIWSAVVVYLIREESLMRYIKKIFRNSISGSDRKNENWSNDSATDFKKDNSKKMDLNPVNDNFPDIFVPKYGDLSSDKHNSKENKPDNSHQNGQIKDDSNQNQNNNLYSNNHNDFLKGNKNGHNSHAVEKDLMTEVNSFVNLILRGEEKPIFQQLKKVKEEGLTVEDFFADVVLELDLAYRMRLDGENNRHNIVLSQVILHWSNAKVEEVMNILLSAKHHNYLDHELGTKVAVMRILRTN